MHSPEGNEGPDQADQAGVGVGVSDELAPDHDKDEPSQDTGWRHLVRPILIRRSSSPGVQLGG